MRKQIFTTGFVLFSLMLPFEATAASFSQIYVFGDSLSDSGNAFRATGIPPSPPYFQGRLSNGPVWVEYLAEDLGLSPSQQTNYAFLGATTGSTNTTIPVLSGLQQQLDTFKATNTQADPNALYVVWAGANDYLGGGVTDPSVPVTNLSTTVSSLAGYGAENILVANLPDLGNLPATNRDVQTASLLNTLTGAHNLGLSASLNSLSQTTDANIIPLDVNFLFNRAIAAPAEFGFTNVTDACLLVGCTNPNEYIFWDELHPTTGVHKILGEAAFSALEAKSVPEPSTVLGMLAIGVGILALHKRQ